MYLTPKHSKKKRAHIWDESNQRSVCKLSSTGGLDPGKYHLTETTNGRALCQMCKSVMASKGVDRNLRINGIADTVMHFGKMYRGRLWREVPDDYLRWMVKECSGKQKAIAEKVLRVKSQWKPRLKDATPMFDRQHEITMELVNVLEDTPDAKLENRFQPANPSMKWQEADDGGDPPF